MTDRQELISRIRLINTENIGPVTFYRLLAKYKTAGKALENLPPASRPFPEDAARREIKLAENKGIAILNFDDPAYPENLKHINDAPPLLYVLGNPEILSHQLSVSVVGARNASVNGRKLASRLAYELTNNNVLIISGMARGIDSAAHKGAMFAQNKQGPTVAVLGSGVDVIYPAENEELYRQIAAQGAVISEFPLGAKPQVNKFPRRNRIVSALSDGTLVVEANLNSGSLITARMALEQGREVFAVPGSPLDGRSAGTNKLIKDGAVLVETAEDILNGLNLSSARQIKPFAIPHNPDLFDIPLDKVQNNADIPKQNKCEEASSIIEFLDYDGVYVDEIIRTSGLSPAEVSMQILELEMDNRIERQPGNKVALIKR